MLAPQRAMAKARLEKASLDDEIAKLKAKNDELSQQNGELEADNDEFQCPLHSTALRERRTLLWIAVGGGADQCGSVG